LEVTYYCGLIEFGDSINDKIVQQDEEITSSSKAA
jgi:hypothetical protein